MPIKDYLSLPDEGKAAFLNNFSNKLGGYAAALDVTPAEAASVVADTAMFNYILDLQEAYKTKKQDITKYKNILRDGPLGTPPGPVPTAPVLPAAPAVVAEGIFIRIRKLVKHIKTHPAYNEAIGEDLGIVGDEIVVDIPSLKPVITGGLDAGRPLIKWSKGPVADSIDIYVERDAASGFVYLINDTQPDYIDTFPIPDGVNVVVWRYKAIYRIGDEQVGQFSEIISITVTRQTGV